MQENPVEYSTSEQGVQTSVDFLSLSLLRWLYRSVNLISLCPSSVLSLERVDIYLA